MAMRVICFFLVASLLVSCSGWWRRRRRGWAGCSSLSDPRRGSVSWGGLSHGSTATYTCDSYYNLNGDSSRTCNNGGWTGSAPTCVLACSTPTRPLNGYVHVSGSSAEYSCRLGYKLSGQRYRYCRYQWWSHQWTGSAPQCVKKVCKTLDSPQNGLVQISGNKASYTCATNYKLDGASTRHCIYGEWDDYAPSCVLACDDLYDPLNGKVEIVGTTANYSCGANYGISGNRVRRCENDVWTGSEPTCNKLCTKLDSPLHGLVKISEDKFEASYTCTANFELKGAPTLNCINGVWDGSASSCVLTCLHLSGPLNGEVQIVGTTAIYSCGGSYSITGNKERRCENGVWTGSAPTCNNVATAPRNVNVATRNATIVLIEWDVPELVNGNLSSYRVDYGNNKSKISNSTSILLTDLTPHTSYTYTVRAIVTRTLGNCSQYLWGKETFEKSFTTRQAKPSSPQNLSLIKRRLTSDSVTVDWQSPVFPNGCNFYVINYRVGNYTAATEETKQAYTSAFPPYTLSGLQPFTSYVVWVQAVNNEESSTLDSDPSNLVTCKTLTDVPSQPQQLRYVNKQSTSVRLQWHPPLHLNGVTEKYNIMLAKGRSVSPHTHNDKSLAVPMTVDGNISNARLTNLRELTWYSVWVVAVNVRETDGKQLTSPPSDVKVFGTPGGPLSAPRSVRSYVSDVSVVITWETPLNVTSESKMWYRVSYYNTSSNPTKEIVYEYVSGRENKVATFYYLRPSTNYRIKIMANVGHHLWTSSVTHDFTTETETISQLCETPTVTKKSPFSVGLSLYCAFGKAPDVCYMDYYSISYRLHNSGNSFRKKTTRFSVFQLDWLIPFTSYEIRLTAVYHPTYCNIFSSPSPRLIVKTDPVAPTAPRNVRETTINARDVVIQWDVPEYVNGTVSRYRVGYINGGYLSSTSTSIHLTDLKPYTSYTYIVQTLVKHFPKNASEQHLWGSKSLERLFTTLQAKPSPPGNLRVIERSLTSTSATVKWQAPVSPNGQNSYIINYRVDGVGTCTIVIFPANASQKEMDVSLYYTLSGLQPFTSYTVWVQAVNKEGSSKLTSEPSNVEALKTLTDAPSQPQHLRYVNTQSTSVHLQWQPPLHFNGMITKYNIVLAEGRSVNPETHSNKSLAVPTTVDSNVSNTTLTNLTQLTWYSVWIVAVNVRETDGKQLTSFPSDATVFSTPGGPFSAPQTVRSNVSGVSAVITWERPLNLPRPVTWYRLSYYNVSRNSSKQIYYEYVSAKKPKSVTLYDLRPHTNYRTEIKALVGHELWTLSASHNFTTKQIAPSPPQNLQTTAVGARSVTVMWSPPLHANGVLRHYRVFVQSGRSRSPSSQGINVYGSLNSQPQTHLNVSGLTAVTQYHVWVAAVNVDDGDLISQLAGPANFTTIA